MSVDALQLDRPHLPPSLFTPRTVAPPPRPLSGFAAVAAMRRNMLEVIDAELFEVPFRRRRLFGRDYLAVCDPDLLQAILIDHADAFGRAASQQRVFRPAIGEGLLVAEGATWRRQRRAAAPAFRHELLRGMIPAFAAVANETSRRIAVLGRFGPVDVEPQMRRATLDIIMRTLLASFEGDTDTHLVAANLREFAEAMARPTLLDLIGAPAWIPAPGRSLLRRRIGGMREEARRALDRRRPCQGEPGDLLGALLGARDPETGQGLSDDELVDNILTFIGAGHETTAVMLTWALGLVARAPEVQERLAAEACEVLGDGPVTADNLDGLRFHEQVLNEALRLFTPGPFLLREAIRDVDLGPVAVTKVTEVWAYLYVIHRNPRLWDDPAAFDPDRFSPERSQGRHRFAFVPFGAGPRVCIGSRVAMMEAKTMLATLVRALSFAPASEEEPVPTFRLTLTPKGGMPLKINARA